MAVHLLEGLFFGNKNTQQIINQRERLLALGSLSAGLTHELNNPAAAAVSATAALRERVAGMRHKLGMIAAGRYEPEALLTLVDIQERTAEQVAKAMPVSPLEASDREDAIGDWLEDHGIQGGWQLAPTFVQAGLDTDWLDQVEAAVEEGHWKARSVAQLHGRDRAADERDRGLHDPGVHPGQCRPSVLPARPGAVPGRRRPRTSRQHPADALRKDRPSDHGGQGVRPHPAEHSRLPRRAQPGVDEHHRQRGLGHRGIGR